MDFEVDRADIHECRVVEGNPPDLAPGQALLRVDRFALTSNNITYAVMGDALKYWDFFPTSEPHAWGRIPVWGYAEVIASTIDDVAAGTRLYGYLPTSTHLVVMPGRVDPRGFVDTAPHRTSLPGGSRHWPGSRRSPRRKPWRDCRRNGARRRCSRSSARWRRARKTTCSTCSTSWLPSCSPTRPRSASAPGSARSVISTLRRFDSGGVLMDDTIEDGAVREAAFAIVPRAAMAEALEKIDAIVRPPGDLYFTELRASTAS